MSPLWLHREAIRLQCFLRVRICTRLKRGNTPHIFHDDLYPICSEQHGSEHRMYLIMEGLDKLPELVKSALVFACNSGKSLSWKVQENDKGILVQLVWKSNSSDPAPVCSNWNSKLTPDSNTPPEKRRVCPSRARRNARRLQSFLEKKGTASSIKSQPASQEPKG